MNDNFPFMRRYREIAKKVPEEYRAKFYDILIDYALDDIEPSEEEWALLASFEGVRGMIDAWKSKKNNGSKGGRPKTETKPKHNQTKPNHNQTKPNANLTEQKEKGKSINTKKEKEKTPTESKRKRAEGVMEAYNMICTSLPKARSLTEQRIRHVNARLEEHSADDMRAVFDKAQASRFLTGKVKDWRADFDWLINANNFVKVLEGRYDDRDPLQSTYEQDMAEILQGADPEELARAERILT